MNISIPTDSVILKKLALSKQIFQRGLIHSQSETNVDKLMAVILFDLSTETVLNAIITSIDSSKTPSDGFPSLLNQVESMLTSATLGGIPDRANILRVHSIRNDAQHDARYPNNSEVSDCQTYTRDFLKKIVEQVWGLNFEQISLADLIQNEKIKNILKDADLALERKEIQTAINESVMGLEKTLSIVGGSLVGGSLTYLFDQIVTTSSFDGMKGNDEITRSFKKIQETLRFVSLGLDYSKYLKFKSITGQPLFTLGNDKPKDFFDQKKDPALNDAEFVVAFAIDSVLLIEEKVGDIDKPFGKDPVWF
ncbi:hypothetical protein NZNM25_01460 [Nitrosopumilus zosterae]|uniref:Uncharacterized protein n=1 Tax=Nitrosopumilus zosterae TaxID=718286 RepID=A0A2S2KPD7_9ARCH|nr:hypothetical protein [Nitrosopumilus zosterae]BDQ31142.1 hypothetical protein NZOSNM25_001253 [Nitrosopumilus zosterae]GBH33355.1 hypothetical protein NZNM25_01460 [Nitrosopumilus zosterae]